MYNATFSFSHQSSPDYISADKVWPGKIQNQQDDLNTSIDILVYRWISPKIIFHVGLLMWRLVWHSEGGFIGTLSPVCVTAELISNVLILNGCSEHGARIWSKSGISICWRHMVTSTESSNPDLFFGATCSELPLYPKYHAQYSYLPIIDNIVILCLFQILLLCNINNFVKRN